MFKVFNLSVVNVIPDAYREAANQVAALYGCGENNISIKLVDSKGDTYCGCHSWWNPEDYALFSNAELRAQIVPSELQPSLEFLYERLMLDGDAQENWTAALALHELSEVLEEV